MPVNEEKKPYCCHIECGKVAEFTIYEQRGDLPSYGCYTEMCADHVGVHLGTTEGGRPGVTVTAWHVYLIA